MEYTIKATPFPVVECQLNANEKMITESGSMVWMTPNMNMETSASGGLSRLFSGEKIFQNIYTAKGGPGMITFGSSFPGRIAVIDVGQESWIVQKSAFLASEATVNLSIHFKKKLGAGFFGGEGFIMQKLSGNGKAFIEIDGSAIRYQLAPGQQLIVDTGHVVLMSATCQMDIQTVKGVKNIVFGGEGLFNTVVTGPGEVVIQTMPTAKLAQAIQPYIVTGK
jgi:uncharacterized protein (TIGR00266 family)